MKKLAILAVLAVGASSHAVWYTNEAAFNAAVTDWERVRGFERL